MGDVRYRINPQSHEARSLFAEVRPCLPAACSRTAQPCGNVPSEQLAGAQAGVLRRILTMERK
jgi:hypothetical protein